MLLKAYRYVDSLYSSGDDYHTYVKVNLLEFNVIKETPKGMWIELYDGHQKFVNLSARKKYACVSKEDALISFISRKKAQIRILKTRLNHAKDALILVGVKIDDI